MIVSRRRYVRLRNDRDELRRSKERAEQGWDGAIATIRRLEQERDTLANERLTLVADGASLADQLAELRKPHPVKAVRLRLADGSEVTVQEAVNVTHDIVGNAEWVVARNKESVPIGVFRSESIAGYEFIYEGTSRRKRTNVDNKATA